MPVIVSKSPQETVELGKEIAKIVKDGSIVLLYGDLGSGKTCFTGGFAKEYCGEEIVQSPTYAIANEYGNSEKGLVHIDAYRLRSEIELLGTGFEDYVASGRTILIEWADKVDAIMPKNALKIRIKYVDESRREISYGD